MGIPAAIVTSIGVGICCCHSDPPCIPQSGIVVQGSAITSSGKLPNARIADLIIASCGHTGVIVTGSSHSFSEKRPMAHIGSRFTGCFIGTIVTGSPNVTV